MTTKTYKFGGITICVRRKDIANVRRYDDVLEVVEDYEGSSGQRLLLLKQSNGATLVTTAMVPSEQLDEWLGTG